MKRHWLVSAGLTLAAVTAWTAGRPREILFEKRMLDSGAAETAAYADVNQDGRVDIISGDYWYEGPRWIPHRFRELPFTNNYVDNFSDLPLDINADGRVDVAGCSWFNHRLVWWENPGKGTGMWKERLVENASPIEFCFLVDIDNDGKAREVLPQFGNAGMPLAWYEAQSGTLAKHAVSPKSMGHGIGAGDVNGDGRTDILTPKGWFEAPPDPRAENWTFHADFDLVSTGFLHVLDINGDGRNDILTGLAHDYGVLWLEQAPGGKWVRRVIDDSWSQPHATTLVDLNADGKLDLVTGKRYMAHNGRDPGEREPLGVYWYEHRKTDDGKGIEWIRHVLDYSTRTGAGMQIAAADIDGDGDIDLAMGGKSGLFLFENLTKKAVARVRPK